MAAFYRNEEAAPIAPETESTTRRRELNALAGYGAAFVSLGLVTSSLGPTLPGLASHTHSTLGEVSVLFVARALGYLGGTLGVGRIFDRVPGHPVLGIVLFAMAATMFGAPVAGALWMLAAIMLVLGVAEGTLDVGANTLLVWTFKERSGPYLNALHCMFGVGAFLSPAIVARVIDRTGDITWAYWILGIYLLPVTAWIALQRNPSPWSSPEHAKSGSTSLRSVTGLLALIVAFFVIYIGAESGFGGWIYSYALESRLEDAEGAAYVNSMFWGALAAGRLATIPFAARIRPRYILLAALIGTLASFSVILAVPGSVWALRIGSAGAGLSMAGIFPTMLALAGRHMPVTGKVNSLLFAGASLGSVIFPWLIGQLFEPYGPRSSMVVILACAFGALVVLVAILGAISARERSRPST